jgi:DNA (cytosine-5)-methyltransferase 1
MNVNVISKIAQLARHLSTIKLGIVNKGKIDEYQGRANIENIHQLHASGFIAGASFSVDSSNDIGIVFKVDPEGDRTVSPKEHKRRDGSVTIGARIDVRSKEIADKMPDPNNIVVYYLDGMIVLMPKPSDVNNAKRIEQLKRALELKHFKTIALYAGVGTLDDSLHEGFAMNGINTELSMATDTWETGLSALFGSNLAASGNTKTMAIGIDQLCAMGSMDYSGVTMLTAGIPCKGASKLNIATRDLPEMHPMAGHQVINLAMFMQSANWEIPIVLVENVTAWADTVSCSMLTRIFEEQGYQVQLVGDHVDGAYCGINSNDYGDIERRVRMAFLATPKGVSIDMAKMNELRTGKSKLTVGDIRLNDDQVDPIEYEYGNHLDSDKKKGKGWVNRIVDDADTSTPLLSAECYKQRVEDPKFKHQTIAGKTRLPTPEENAALKGQPLRLINALTFKTHAHVALGNGCARKPFVAFAYGLSSTLLDWYQSVITPLPGPALSRTQLSFGF